MINKYICYLFILQICICIFEYNLRNIVCYLKGFENKLNYVKKRQINIEKWYMFLILYQFVLEIKNGVIIKIVKYVS